jgi:hypothetical protein
VDVVVTNPATTPPTPSATLKGAFNYAQPVGSPSVSSVTPSNGSSAGGTPITVAGSGFLAGDVVIVGGNNATTVTVVNGSTITAYTPANPAGAADVVVTRACPSFPSCPSSAPLTGGFTYTTPPAPSITSVSPNSGTVNGGTAITINGANFQYGASVMIGGRPAAVQTWTSSYINATTPVGQSTGAVDVVVTNPDGQSAPTLTGGYTYN